MLGFRRSIMVLGLAVSFVLGQESGPKGVHPRATPDDYAVNASAHGAIYAASLVPADQAKHLFAFDITGKYLVFEIACFPQESRPLAVDPDDFLIKRDKGELTHQTEPSAVALAIQLQNSPRPPESRGNTQVATEAQIGYESGRDPVTGRRGSGVYEGVGIGVEHGGIDSRPPDYPKPGGTPDDRRVLETQLQERQLPAGKFDHAVAGYLYYLRASVKKDSGGNYLLQHLGETNAAGVSETVGLVVPAKNR